MHLDIASWSYTGSFFLSLAIPFIVYLKLTPSIRHIIKTLGSVLLSAVSMSLLVFAAWAALDFVLSMHLDALDRNGSEVWTQEEMSTWSQKDWHYYELAMSDGGRNVFAIFVFPLVALAYSTIVILGFGLFAFAKGQIPNKSFKRDRSNRAAP